MRLQNTKIKLTMSIPIDQPDCNGVVYTREAVENAICKFPMNIPMLFQEDAETDAKVIGTTTGGSCIVNWDPDNQIYKLSVDGVIFYGGAEIAINRVEDGKVSDFEFKSIGLSI